MSPKPGGMPRAPPPRPQEGGGAAPLTFLLHHFGRALLEDGVGLDNLGPAPAPAVPIALPVPVPFLLLLLDGDIFSGPGEGGDGLSPTPMSPATLPGSRFSSQGTFCPPRPRRAATRRQNRLRTPQKCLRGHLLFLDLPANYVGGEGFLQTRAEGQVTARAEISNRNPTGRGGWRRRLGTRLRPAWTSSPRSTPKSAPDCRSWGPSSHPTCAVRGPRAPTPQALGQEAGSLQKGVGLGIPPPPTHLLHASQGEVSGADGGQAPGGEGGGGRAPSEQPPCPGEPRPQAAR